MPDLAMAGGFSDETHAFKALALGAPNFKEVCMGRAQMIPGMVGKNIGEWIKAGMLPKTVSRFGSKADEIFVSYEELKAKYGKDVEKLPLGAVGIYTASQKIRTRLQQKMAGSRNFNRSTLGARPRPLVLSTSMTGWLLIYCQRMSIALAMTRGLDAWARFLPRLSSTRRYSMNCVPGEGRMMRKYWCAFVAVLVIMMSFANQLHAEAPALVFPYTRQTNLAPGAYKFIFSLYDSPVAVTPLWASEKVALTLKTPLLVYNLGSGVVKIPASIDFSQQLFLKVVKTSPAPKVVIANREPLPIVPYALHSENLSSTPISAASPVLTDFTVTPYVDCITAPFTPTFNEGVAVSSVSSIVGSASGTVIYVSNVFSTDDGTTWLPQSLEGQLMRVTTVSGAWTPLPNVSYMNLIAGNTYRFGIRYTRASGTATIPDGRCEILVAPH